MSTATAFLGTMVGQWVRVTPAKGRVVVGILEDVCDAYDPGDIILTIRNNGDPWRSRWGDVDRFKLVTENSRP